jgi:hypothetical protein
VSLPSLFVCTFACTLACRAALCDAWPRSSKQCPSTAGLDGLPPERTEGELLGSIPLPIPQHKHNPIASRTWNSLLSLTAFRAELGCMGNSASILRHCFPPLPPASCCGSPPLCFVTRKTVEKVALLTTTQHLNNQTSSSPHVIIPSVADWLPDDIVACHPGSPPTRTSIGHGQGVDIPEPVVDLGRLGVPIRPEQHEPSTPRKHSKAVAVPGREDQGHLPIEEEQLELE